MSNYDFVKVQSVKLCGRNTNLYNVYETKQNEISEIIETCERPGVTVVTSRAKFIKRQSGNSKIFVAQVAGKTKKEAEENFWEQF